MLFENGSWNITGIMYREKIWMPALEMMDYREYAMVDKKILLEILIQRGLFPQAMSVVEAFGFEGVEECELLKLASRMIIRCDCTEDEELIALSSHVYRNEFMMK